MAPTHSRQLLVYALPTIAVILTYLWYKKKRASKKKKDTFDSSSINSTAINKDCELPKAEIYVPTENLEIALADAARDCTPESSPQRYSRSLSTPIDIIVPREHKSKNNAVIISDEDLDIEIEKIKSMKASVVEPYHISKDSVDSASIKTSPQPEEFKHTPMKSAKKANTNTPKLPTGNRNGKRGNNKQMKKNQNHKAMAQVEEKLECLKISESKTETPKVSEASNKRQNYERDSANNSPDVMMPSPTMSVISDNNSEGSSNDSGKGGSEVATPPLSTAPAADEKTFYEFLVKQNLCGQLIGKEGNFVNKIKAESKAYVSLRAHPTDRSRKVCSLYGDRAQINKALRMIQRKFAKIPDFSTEQVFIQEEVMPDMTMNPEFLFLRLVEGVNNEGAISCIVAPNHLFMQQPSHPTFPSLAILHNIMADAFALTGEPEVHRPIHAGIVCAIKSCGLWQRIMVLNSYPETDSSYITYLDYGGYAMVSNSDLRQIAPNFLFAPFQAIECILHGVKPAGGQMWSRAAYDFVRETAVGYPCITQIIGYKEGLQIPLVRLYAMCKSGSCVCLNDELINQGYAEITETCEIITDCELPPEEEVLQSEARATVSSTLVCSDIQNECEFGADIKSAEATATA